MSIKTQTAWLTLGSTYALQKATTEKLSVFYAVVLLFSCRLSRVALVIIGVLVSARYVNKPALLAHVWQIMLTNLLP